MKAENLIYIVVVAGLILYTSQQFRKAGLDPAGVKKQFAEVEGQLKDTGNRRPLQANRAGDKRTAELAQNLESDDPKVRQRAAQTLQSVRHPQSVTLGIKALQDPDAKVRASAARSLGSLGEARAAVPILALLDDPDLRTRQAAVYALGRLQEPRAVEPLLAMLREPAVGTRQGAAQALQDIGAPAVDGLIVALSDRDQRVRELAIRALGNLADKRAVEPLIACLNDRSLKVRHRAMGALARMRDPRVTQPVVAALDQPAMTFRALEALAKISDPKTIPPIVEMLKHKDARVRTRAVNTLKGFGSPAVEAVIPLINDTNNVLRMQAVRVLAAADDERRIDPLIVVLNDRHEDVRREAARGLAWSDDVKAMEALRTEFDCKNLPVICGACAFYVREGRPDGEAMILSALASHGDRKMATTLMNSDNQQLADAGKQWAKARGYTVMKTVLGGKTAKWGQR